MTIRLVASGSSAEVHARLEIIHARQKLLQACIAYIHDGPGIVQQRVRDASDWSGITRNTLIEATR